MISNETFYRLKKASHAIYEESVKHPRDRKRHIYWINEMIREHARYVAKACRESKIPMAKKSEKFVWNGYVNVNIPQARSNDVAKAIKDEKWVFAQMGQTIVDGYKLAVRADPENESFVATLTCFEKSSDNYGYVLSAFADDWYTAVAVLLFKHYHVTEQNWTAYRQDTTNRYG